jgi:hypothetical protein
VAAPARAHAFREAPRLDPKRRMQAPTPGEVLLINPFYPKDAHASFGKHVLTPTLALTSLAGVTPPGGESATGTRTCCNVRSRASRSLSTPELAGLSRCFDTAGELLVLAW